MAGLRPARGRSFQRKSDASHGRRGCKTVPSTNRSLSVTVSLSTIGNRHDRQSPCAMASLGHGSSCRASQEHPFLLLDRHTVFTDHSTSPCQEPSCFLANTALPLRYCGVARILSARSARDGELPWCNCACPYVPPLCVPPLALSAGTPASPPLMTSDDYQMTSGALAGSAAFGCTFAATAATAGTEGVSVGVVGACRPRCGFVAAAAAGAWHASTHCESM